MCVGPQSVGLVVLLGKVKVVDLLLVEGSGGTHTFLGKSFLPFSVCFKCLCMFFPPAYEVAVEGRFLGSLFGRLLLQ